MRGGSVPGPEDDRSVLGLLRYQSRACGWVGSPLYEELLARAADDYEAGGATARVLTGHEEDPVGSALALRLMGAVHRLVLEGRAPDLAELYASGAEDPAAAWPPFQRLLEEREAELRELVERPVQTNEVGRCAAFLPGFFAVAESGLPLRLLEIGASAGLNLSWDRYRYEAPDFSWGRPESPVRIGFELDGPALKSAPARVEVAERLGCDPDPIDPAAEEGRLTLLSYIWPDQLERMERSRAALELAAAAPVTVERARAADWARRQLGEPAPGRLTLVYHSVVMQYLSEDEREELDEALADAGERATPEAPLARLAMEPDGDRAALHLTTWPGGEVRLLGRAGYHGTPVALTAGQA